MSKCRDTQQNLDSVITNMNNTLTKIRDTAKYEAVVYGRHYAVATYHTILKDHREIKK